MAYRLLWSITDRASAFYRWLKDRVVLPPESGGEFMCDVCVEIDAIMARYKRLRDQISDEQTRDAAELLLAELEARKAALHSE